MVWPPYFLAYPHVFLTCGPFIGFLGFFHVGQSYSCVGVDRHDGYSADSSAGLAQCGFVGGFIPNFAIFALVSDHLRNFCFYSWDSLLVLTSLLRLPILLSLSLLWWLALGVTAAAHLLWWPLLCCLRGISFCSSSAVSSSSYFCYGCCQLLLSLLGVSVQLVLVHLRFFHSVSCGWLPFWGSPAGCSFTRGRPYGKRSSSSSRSDGRQRFRGVGGGGGFLLPALRVSGSGYHLLSGGCLSLHWQAWRDRDAEPWVVEVLRVGYCLPFLSTLPLSNVPIPMPSSSPHLHQWGCSGGGHLGLHCQGCCGAYPLTSPDFYSRLFVVWQTSGSWRPVIDLSHLIRLVDVSPFHMGSIQSVLLSVRQGDWIASIDPMEAYLQVPVPPVSRHFLRFMFQDTVSQFNALCFGLSTAPQVFTRVLAPVSALLHSMGVPYETISRRLASPVNLSGVPPWGSSDCPPPLSRVGGLWSTPRIPTWFPHWWFSFWGLSSTPPLSGLLRRRSASPGCNRQPQSFSPASRLPRAYGYRSSASFLRWLT